ncbi:MAG: hypothetical protein KGY39_04485 [Anaerolineales bacterium]|nr:hypothetical protein [Anaerolineales bacterium]MBS3752386.1 hypothetical protein [Anaerolineales bacterium]
MKLIDRYLHEVKRHLPRKNREDILAELRSSLVDALESQAGEDASEEEARALLKEWGPPREVAASYHPEGQYLIGPALYPLFRMVVGIALAAVIGAQLLAWALAIAIGREPFVLWDALASLLNSIPMTVGSVAIVFMILQRFEVRPELEEDWDPSSLPRITDTEEVKRGELIAGVVFSILVLVLLVAFPEWVGFVTLPEGRFYANPVLGRYLGWIVISLLAGIGLNIYLLWQGRWGTVTRVLKVAVNLLSIGVLALLVRAHTTWLAARDAEGFLMTLEKFPELLEEGFHLVGMHAFRLAFGVALIVTSIETVVLIYRLLKAQLGKEYSPQGLKSEIN